MRVPPLGAYFAEDLDVCLRPEAILSAAITHAHPEGKSGAVAVAVAAAMAWRLRDRPKEEAAEALLREVYERTPDGETRVGIARALAMELAEGPTKAHAMTKRILRRFREGGLPAADEVVRTEAADLFAQAASAR